MVKDIERYISFCKDCKINLCDFCEIEHNKNNKNNNKNELRIKIDYLKFEINDIINILNIIKDNMEIYFNINNNIINNYDLKNKNYEILMNLNNSLYLISFFSK